LCRYLDVRGDWQGRPLCAQPRHRILAFGAAAHSPKICVLNALQATTSSRSMPNQEFTSRKYPVQLARTLVIGGIMVMLLLGIAFVWFRMGQGPLFVALGTFAVMGMAVGLIWLVLTFLAWIARGED